MFKTVQIVAHTTGGVVKSAPEQITEREYEQLKEGLKALMPNPVYVEFNTEDGYVIIPGSQIIYIEVNLT